MEEKRHGLLLQTIPYLEGRKILKILTAEEGLITISTPRKISPVLTSPFVWAEWVYKVASPSIYSFKDGTLLDDLQSLKENFRRLSVAGQMASDLLKTQLPGKTAHDALSLTLACFRKLPLFSQPDVLHAAFRLKLLLSEGVLHSEALSSSFLQTLGFSRSFQELASLPFHGEEIAKIDALFKSWTGR